MLSTRLFSSVPVPRSCFGGLFLKCLLKTPCRQRALIGDIFNSETEPNGKLFFHSGYAVTYLPKNNPHTHIRQFFLSTKRMGSFGRNGSSGIRTQDRPVMSRLLWPTELSFLSSKKIQGRCDICLFTTVAVLDRQLQQRLKPPGTFDCSFSHRRCDRWLKGFTEKEKKKHYLHQEKDINSMQSGACGIRTHAFRSQSPVRYRFANALCCGSRSTLPHVIYFKNTIDIFMFFLERLHQS